MGRAGHARELRIRYGFIGQPVEISQDQRHTKRVRQGIERRIDAGTFVASFEVAQRHRLLTDPRGVRLCRILELDLPDSSTALQVIQAVSGLDPREPGAEG